MELSPNWSRDIFPHMALKNVLTTLLRNLKDLELLKKKKRKKKKKKPPPAPPHLNQFCELNKLIHQIDSMQKNNS